MNKKDLKKELNGEPAYTFSYTPSEDARKVTIEIVSTTPMTAWDLVCAVCDWINDFISHAIRGDVDH